MFETAALQSVRMCWYPYYEPDGMGYIGDYQQVYVRPSHLAVQRWDYRLPII